MTDAGSLVEQLKGRLAALEAREEGPGWLIEGVSTLLNQAEEELADDGQGYYDEETTVASSDTLAIDIKVAREIIERLENGEPLGGEGEATQALFQELTLRALETQDTFPCFLFPLPGASSGFMVFPYRHPERQETVALLGYGTHADTLNPPLRGLVSHEAGEVHLSSADEYSTDDPKLLREKEIVCDQIGLSMLGPAFTGGMEAMESHLDQLEVGSNHPSWVARAVASSYSAVQLWSEPLQEVMREHLQSLVDQEEDLSPIDDRLLASIDLPGLCEEVRTFKTEEEDITGGSPPETVAEEEIRDALERH